VLEEIEKRSQGLLSKGIAARFIDKGEDSKEVVRPVEELRDAINYYQVSGHQNIVLSTVDMGVQISQQQAIYDQITDLTVSVLRLALLLAWMSDSFIESSFDELLKLREVTQSPEPTTVPTDK